MQTLNKLNLRYSITVGIRYFSVNGIPTSKPRYRYSDIGSVFAVYRSMNSMLCRITLRYNILQCRHTLNCSLTDHNHWKLITFTFILGLNYSFSVTGIFGNFLVGGGNFKIIFQFQNWNSRWPWCGSSIHLVLRVKFHPEIISRSPRAARQTREGLRKQPFSSVNPYPEQKCPQPTFASISPKI